MAGQNKNMPNIRILGIGVAGAVMLAAIFVTAAWAQTNSSGQLQHPKVPNPATLTGPRAEAVYQAVRGQLRANYLRAGDPIAEAYQTWRRFNRLPYRSGPHGERFVNHYGNAKAADYGKFEDLSPLPEGAIIIKDSFTVTRNGDLKSGPLFMMEKMPAGFPSRAGTWRFMMLRGNGALVGITDGVDADKVRFCAECHFNAGAKRDYLYFMPREVRVTR
jgi:cytochrome P460